MAWIAGNHHESRVFNTEHLAAGIDNQPRQQADIKLLGPRVKSMQVARFCQPEQVAA